MNSSKDLSLIRELYKNGENIIQYLKNANFAIVSSGVIPTGEKDRYWIYYWGTDAKHNTYPFLTKIDVTYYRIKLIIHQ